MSSYISGTYYIEGRRLQQVIDQCQIDLDIAIQNVYVQQTHILDLKNEQIKNDANYFSDKEQANEKFEQMQMRESEEKQKKLQKIKEELRLLKIQMKVFDENAEKVTCFLQRQRVLEDLIHDENVDMEYLELKLKQHKQLTDSELTETFEKDIDKQMKLETLGEITFVNNKESISLKLEENELDDAKSNMIKKKPVDIFAKKIRFILEKSRNTNFPSVIDLKNEFDGQPEYSRTAFAVKNMAKLDKIIQQFERMNIQQKSQDEQKYRKVKEYRALCKMLLMDCDENMIIKDNNLRELTQVCDELYKKYQKKKEREYITNAVAVVMTRYGILFQNSSDNFDDRKLYFHMEDANLEVYGTEYDQMQIAVSGEYEGERPTLDEKRKCVSSVRHFCEKMKLIENDLAEEFQIQFKKVIVEEPEEETVVMKKKSNGYISKGHMHGAAQKADLIS